MTHSDIVLLGLGLLAAATLAIAIVAALILEMLALRSEYGTWLDALVFAGLAGVCGYIAAMAVGLLIEEPWLLIR